MMLGLVMLVRRAGESRPPYAPVLAVTFVEAAVWPLLDR
jgi:hypothetical protein